MPIWYPYSTTPWSSPTATTGTATAWDAASTTSVWVTSSTTTSATTVAIYGQQAALYQAQAVQTQAVYDEQRAYQRWLIAPAPPWQAPLFRPAAPAIIRPEDELRRDRELYQRAIDEHSEQEATRLQRLIERHEMDVAEQQLRLEEARQRAREDQLQRDAAKLRARELLFEHMTSQQRETFDANGWFVVEGGKSKTRYRIRADESLVGNVDVLQLNGNGISHRLCAHVRHGTVPFGDQLLAQKVMLELAEDDFLRVANRHAAR